MFNIARTKKDNNEWSDIHMLRKNESVSELVKWEGSKYSIAAWNWNVFLLTPSPVKLTQSKDRQQTCFWRKQYK